MTSSESACCLAILRARSFASDLQHNNRQNTVKAVINNYYYYNGRSESITGLCRILARISISLGFVPILALPGFQNILRFHNGGQNSLRKPNTNRTKATCLLLPPTPSPYAMTTKHRQAKNHSLTVSPFIILPQLLFPPPLPLVQC